MVKIEGKVITISDNRGKARECSASAVKLYTVNDLQAETPEEGEPDDIDNNVFPDLDSEPSELGSEPDESGNDPDYYPEYDEPEECDGETLYSKCDPADDQEIHLIEVLPLRDARGRDARIDEARRKEVEGVEDMGT